MANPVEFLGVLLFIIPFLQYFVFFVFTLTYGRIAMFGYRTHSPWFVKVLVFFGTGLFSLFCGISLSGIIVGGADPITGLLRILMLDVFVSGLTCAVVVAVGLFLVSRNIYNVKGMERSIEDLQQRVKRAEQAARTPLVKRLAGPTMLAGIIVLAGILIYSVINFQGVPSYSDRISSAIGIPLEDIQSMLGTAGGMMDQLGDLGDGNRAEGCESLSSIFFANADEFMAGELTEYVNPAVEGTIEASSGSEVMAMYRVEHSGDTYALAPTDDGRVCSAKIEGEAGLFCGCFDLSGLPF